MDDHGTRPRLVVLADDGGIAVQLAFYRALRRNRDGNRTLCRPDFSSVLADAGLGRISRTSAVRLFRDAAGRPLESTALDSLDTADWNIGTRPDRLLLAGKDVVLGAVESVATPDAGFGQTDVSHVALARTALP